MPRRSLCALEAESAAGGFVCWRRAAGILPQILESVPMRTRWGRVGDRAHGYGVCRVARRSSRTGQPPARTRTHRRQRPPRPPTPAESTGSQAAGLRGFAIPDRHPRLLCFCRWSGVGSFHRCRLGGGCCLRPTRHPRLWLSHRLKRPSARRSATTPRLTRPLGHPSLRVPGVQARTGAPDRLRPRQRGPGGDGVVPRRQPCTVNRSAGPQARAT